MFPHEKMLVTTEMCICEHQRDQFYRCLLQQGWIAAVKEPIIQRC